MVYLNLGGGGGAGGTFGGWGGAGGIFPKSNIPKG